MSTFIFQILSPTVSFILGRQGIPILGNIAIPSWLWHGPSNHFFLLLLSQAENDLPPSGQHFAGTEPGLLIEDGAWLYTPLIPLTPSLFCLFPLHPCFMSAPPNSFFLLCICSASFPNNYNLSLPRSFK